VAEHLGVRRSPYQQLAGNEEILYFDGELILYVLAVEKRLIASEA